MTDDEPTDPRHYLSQPPTPRASAIVAATAREAGEPAPIWMIGALADRAEQIERRIVDLAADTSRIARIERSQVEADHSRREAERDRKRTRAALWKASGLAGTLLASAFVWWMHARDAAVGGEQRALDMIDRANRLEQDIREIRAALMRLGINIKPEPSSGGVFDPVRAPSVLPPNKLSVHLLGDSGSVAEQIPKLQNLQVGTRLVHSMLELQNRPHEEFGLGEDGHGAAGAFWTGADDEQATNRIPMAMVRMGLIVPRAASVRLMEWLPARIGPERIEDGRSHPHP